MTKKCSCVSSKDFHGVEVKVYKNHPDAIIPEYATPGSAGLDVCAVEDITIKPGETKIIKTGLHVEIVNKDKNLNYAIFVMPRSGISLKTPLRIANTPGLIDSDYRGEIGVIGWNSSSTEDIVIKKGSAIAQLVFIPIVNIYFTEVESFEDLSKPEVEHIGYGSTGIDRTKK